MTLQEKARVEATIEDIAKKEGKRPEEIRAAMQEALDAAWTASWEPKNIQARAAWQRLFPGAQKPTVEEFIVKSAAEIRQQKQGAQ